ncbi:hypothetical protein N5912_02530 [Arcobacter lacus]|uniref:type II secretion system protein GspD n=1 Tax=Arcobacter lacus TaxID=1912876 RepID=UPI0021BB98FC|nr:hypothetical protein [Arcobacter lacus]MCT7910695.1 hypothetical protein [Arcobacter lacus]
MKRYIFLKIIILAVIGIAFTGCNSKVLQNNSNSLESMTKEDLNNSAIDKLKNQTVEISKKYIYLKDKKKLSQVLSELGNIDKKIYILQDKDIDIGGYQNLKFSDFFELNKILTSVYNIEMKVEQNSLDINMPKIIKLYPKEKVTILDELRINQNGMLIPSNLLTTLSSYANGWKINYSNDLKEELNKNDYSHFQGTLREFLDYFANVNDYFLEYDYKTKTITYSKYESKLFRYKGTKEKITYSNVINIDLGSSSSSSQTSSQSNGSGGSGIEVKDTYDLIENLKIALKTVIPTQNEKEYFSVIPESGHIVVSTTRNKMYRIEEIINSINNDAFKNIYIKVTLLQTKLNNSHERGINWGYVKGKIDNDGNTVQMLAGGISGQIADLSETISGDSFFKFRGKNGLSAIVQALNEFGDTGIAYQLSSLTTNNVPAMINLANVKDYIYKTEIDNDGETPTVSAEQNEVQGGKFLYIKPSVYDDEIRVNITILDRTINPFTKHEFGTNQYLQSKDLDKKLLNYTAIIKNGEKIIIGGFMQKTLNKGYSGLGNGNILSELVGIKDQDFSSEEIALLLEIVEQ